MYHANVSGELFEWPRLSLIAQNVSLGPYRTHGGELETSKPAMSLTISEILACCLEEREGEEIVVVNVGAGDSCLQESGTECDPVNPLLRLTSPTNITRPPASAGGLPGLEAPQTLKNVRGLLFDPDPASCGLLTATYPHANIFEQGVYAHNVGTLFTAAGVPATPTVLKWDTDASDCDALEAMLHAGHVPRLLMVEFNVLWPPPLRFNLLESPNFRWGALTPFPQQLGNQCSLMHLTERLAAFGYELLQVETWDATFMLGSERSAAAATLPRFDALTWWLRGYADNPTIDGRARLLAETAYAAAATPAAVPEVWLRRIAEAATSGETLSVEETASMLSEFFFFATTGNAVQRDINDTTLPFSLDAGAGSKTTSKTDAKAESESSASSTTAATRVATQHEVARARLGDDRTRLGDRTAPVVLRVDTRSLLPDL